ncbi:putative bifunctional diguanylate cyclase/phosphodiesterase [Glaciecola sp. 2405UD65-10]|uniref:putative bifunctional diguanylate cyclase/phosphodiesterase n=1 Tax=Glaciecola sp. 2405UD65-10 TaxID=3397244 RepID=UPI003B59D38C
MKVNDIHHLNEIPNRYHFIEIIEQIAAKEKYFSLMLLDVMRFSDVSSAFGHKAGDDLLLKIVNHINCIFSNSVAVGRISGDIFGVVFVHAVTASSLRSEHARLYNHFKTPLIVNKTAFIADFNVGVAIRKNPDSNINTIISLAETALKKSKSNRHENFTLLNDDTNEASGRGLTLKADLTRALENDELELYFQPKVDLNTYEIIGGECLLRWNHPLDGVVFPGTLLKAAESYNMMNELGYWTLEHSLKSIAAMNAAGYFVPISVNLSPTQLYDPQLVTTLKRLLNKYDVQTHLLEIELTEDVALSNSLLVKRQLADIKNLGIAISMDDFGKGYSNLSFIRDLELSAIKIDKTFVLELNNSPVNSAIVQATKTICDAKGCETYAEGIETVEQLAMLQAMGINKGQGFLFSQAVPITEYIEQLHIGNFNHIVNPQARITK